VNDTRSGFPETDTVLGSASSEEIVNFLVDVLSTSKILDTSSLSLNQVIAVNGGGDSDGRETSRHELEESHLGGSILASNSLYTGETDNRLVRLEVRKLSIRREIERIVNSHQDEA
jgi:hypothetical protein